MIKLNVFHKIKLISKWTITILIACTYILISCRSNKQKSKIKEVSQSTVVLKGQKDRYSISCKLLGIDDLRTNKELLKIRIWISFSLYDTGKIINIKYDAGTWLAEFYQYRFGLNDNNESILISKNKVESTPHSGWNDFFNQIEKLGIYTLNDNDRRHNSGLCTDANNITVEIVKDSNYFKYDYPCWEAIEDQSQLNKVKKILRIIESEFGFKPFPLDFESVNEIKGFRD